MSDSLNNRSLGKTFRSKKFFFPQKSDFLFELRLDDIEDQLQRLISDGFGL